MAKVMQDEGNSEILTPEDFLGQQIMLIEKAGRTCYQSKRGNITMDTATKFVLMLIRRGHESVLEHSIMTVRFDDCSRGFTHEQVRHRLTAISQESTRYVDYAKGEVDLEQFQLQCIAPPHCDPNEPILLEDGRTLSMTEMFAEYEKFYRGLRQANWRPEEARQALPIGLKSEIVISANLREWRHIFFMRTSKFAHWEIRRVMGNLLETVQGIIPAMFEDFHEAGDDKNGLRYFEQRPLPPEEEFTT